MLDRVTRPVGAVLRAATRPETYPGHFRELTSTAITAAVWPLGLADWVRSPGSRDDESTVSTPVLLVHGFGANKSNWLFLERHLEQAGFGRVESFNYNPLTHDIPALAAACAERADVLKDRYGVSHVHLVGHSLGGVIVRYAVQVGGLRGVPVVVTICAPHGGSGWAGKVGRFGFRGPDAGLQLAPHSDVMRELRTTARPLDTRFVAYYSNLDLIVPARRAMIREPELAATNILVKDHGHLSIMLSRRLAASIVDQLGAAEGLPGYGAPLSPLATRAELDASAAWPEAVGE